MHQTLRPFEGIAEEVADVLLAEAASSRGVEAPKSGLIFKVHAMMPDPVQDVRSQLARLERQAGEYERARLGFPCVRVRGEGADGEQVIPVDVPRLLELSKVPVSTDPRDWPDRPDQLIGSLLPGSEIIDVDARRAAANTRGSLKRFLANRFLGRSGGGSTTVPFTLNARHQGSPYHGRTAFFTPAYFITLGPYGSALTSPVLGNLPSGYYHFGADHPGGGGPSVDYHKRFDIPVNTTGTIDV